VLALQGQLLVQMLRVPSSALRPTTPPPNFLRQSRLGVVVAAAVAAVVHPPSWEEVAAAVVAVVLHPPSWEEVAAVAVAVVHPPSWEEEVVAAVVHPPSWEEVAEPGARHLQQMVGASLLALAAWQRLCVALFLLWLAAS
jgi:hypothetical protein